MSVLLQSLLVFSAVLAVYVLWRSIVVIGPAEIGLVVKRVSGRHNTTDTPIAFAGEAGYQAELLMPGVRLRDRKSTRLNSSHGSISYAVFCLKKKTKKNRKDKHNIQAARAETQRQLNDAAHDTVQ